MSFFCRRGQSSFEFVVIVGIMFMIVIGAFGFVQSRSYSVIKERNDLLLEGVANVIRSELTLAGSVDGDYYRQFTLPQTVEGYNYSIVIKSNTDIVLVAEDSQYVIFLNDNFTGTVNKGVNMVKKVSGNISVNA